MLSFVLIGVILYDSDDCIGLDKIIFIFIFFIIFECFLFIYIIRDWINFVDK